MRRKHETSKTHASRILEILNGARPQSFTELQELLGTSPSVTAYALKVLMPKDGPLIKRDQATRKYEITERGRFLLRNEQLSRAIKVGKAPAQKESYSYVTTELSHMEPVLGSFDRMPFEMGFIGESNINFDKLAEKIKHTLNYLPRVLMREFAEEVAWQKGVREPETLTPPREEGNFYTDRLSYIKEAYDYEITMLIHFNPRQLIRRISWPEMLKDAREKDAHLKEGRKIAQKLELRDLKLDREKMLEEYVTTGLENAVHRGVFLKNMVEPGLEDSLGDIASGEDQLIKKVVEYIKTWCFLAKPLLKDEDIEAAIRKKLGQGYRIVQQTIFMVEKVTTS
jgi:predicted transcriptional regulator